MNTNKLGFTFHRTFALNRDGIRQILALAVELYSQQPDKRQQLSKKIILEKTNLGNIQAKSFPRYASGTGLLDSDGNPTPFGMLVHESDPTMNRADTQWIMHYNMVAPHKSGPVFWSNLVLNNLNKNSGIKNIELADHLRSLSEGQSLQERAIRSTATIFLGTYTKSDGLGSLGILEEGDNGIYLVREPLMPSMRVVSYVLADYWQAVWENRSPIPLMYVTAKGGPASLLLLNQWEMNDILGQMQESGLVFLRQRVRPYLVEYRWESPEQLLEKIYE